MAPYTVNDFKHLMAYFHDGSLNAIHHEDDQLKLDINSCSLLPEENVLNLTLAEENVVRGTLTLLGVTKITENDVELNHKWMNRDDGKLLDFEIIDHQVELGLRWYDVPSEIEIDAYSLICLTAEQVLWSDPLNDVELDLTGIDTTTTRST